MRRHAFIVLTLSLLCGVGCVSTQPAHTPDVTLDVPPSFSTEVTEKRYLTGQDLLHGQVDQVYHLITRAPLTQYHGWFGPRVADQADLHGWAVDVYSRFDPKVAQAYRSAKNGFEANLSEGAEFLTDNGTPYMFARFERKHFQWGEGVSFFSQSTQDTGLYVPHNGHLTYEVWGTTRDHHHTVVARIGVSHPKLGNWGPEVRDAPSIEALKQDRDYKLVEACDPNEFEPSLTAFDKMLDTLVIH